MAQIIRPLKIVVIGGGSTYTPELVSGMIERAATMPVGNLTLVDVEAGRTKLEIVGGLVRRMLQAAGLSTRVELTLDRRRAIEGADFVINQFRVGGLAARAKDERIPLAHGVIGQETTGPGGFAKALRTIPVALAIAQDVTELAPAAWVINFTNPAGIVTEALHRHAKVKCIGLCNVPLTMQMLIAGVMGVELSRLRCDFAGLNHLSWIRRVALDGVDVTAQVVAAAAGSELFVREIPGGADAAHFLRDLGMLPSPYLRYFYFPSEMLAQEQEAAGSAKGTRADEVLRIEADLLQAYQDPALTGKPPLLGERGGSYYSEAALSVMEAMVTNRPAVHVVNVANRGAIPDLGPDSVVETNCLIDGTGAVPLAGPPLPPTIRGLVQQVKAYEELTIAAAVSGDRAVAIQALMANPLVPGAGVAAKLVDDLLAAHAQYLPQFAAGGRGGC